MNPALCSELVERGREGECEAKPCERVSTLKGLAA